MSKINLSFINETLFKKMGRIYREEELEYDEIQHDGSFLLDRNGNRIGTKGDFNNKMIIEKILLEGCWDEHPRLHYKDREPAHSISLNNSIFWTYDLAKNESPLITVTPVDIDSALGEIFWIYQDQSTDLNLLKKKYHVSTYDDYDLYDKDGKPQRNIGSTYGAILKNYNLVNKLLIDLVKKPDSRSHITDMWQEEDQLFPHGIKPCGYATVWNVRHERDGIDYLDMKLIQRSCDLLLYGPSNQIQHVALLQMVAQAVNLKPGRFTWDVQNVHIYDRNIAQAVEELRREPVDCEPHLVLNDNIHDFYEFKPKDIQVKGYPKQKIMTKNPEIKFNS